VAPDEPPAAHHKLICEALDRVIAGKIRRLMIFMPPGSAKSTYTSIRFTPYYLGRCPSKSVIATSYGDVLAMSFGRKVRNLVSSREYSVLFPDGGLSEDERAKGEWSTKAGGSYFAAGVGSGITGRRGDLGLIDDPVKGRIEADSETVRESTWQWYKSDFLTRLKPGAAQIIIQTRWHEDDLSGRILPPDWAGESGTFVGTDRQEWEVICLQAQATTGDPLGRKPGEWLWTEWFTPQFWEETRASQTDIRNWASLYQQIPSPDEGTFFRREWFKRYRVGDEPERLSKYGASDYAVTEGGGDYTEQGVAGFDERLDLYLLDWWRGQETADVWIDAQLNMAQTHSPLAWVAEGGPIRRSIEPFLKQRKRQRGCYFRSEWITSNKDKPTNARAFQGLASMGKVYIPRTEWGDELVEQLVSFPAGKHDDGVDVCGLFGRILDQAFGPGKTPEPVEPERDAWGVRIETDDWKVA